MKTIKITLLLLIALTSCKKESTLEACTSTTPENYDWTLEQAEHVTRKVSDNSITHRVDVVSYLFNYDHKLKGGVYFQSAIDANNYTQAGTYTDSTIDLSIGGGVQYVKTMEAGKLIFERILYSNDTITYVTERNTFKTK